MEHGTIPQHSPLEWPFLFLEMLSHRPHETIVGTLVILRGTHAHRFRGHVAAFTDITSTTAAPDAPPSSPLSPVLEVDQFLSVGVDHFPSVVDTLLRSHRNSVIRAGRVDSKNLRSGAGRRREPFHRYHSH